jgi:hypothetical protein
MDYSRKYLYEFARLLDSKSILVINRDGKLRRIFCPFPVVVLEEVYQFKKDQILSVEAVKITVSLQDVFIIDGKAYLIRYFGILSEDRS